MPCSIWRSNYDYLIVLLRLILSHHQDAASYMKIITIGARSKPFHILFDAANVIPHLTLELNNDKDMK